MRLYIRISKNKSIIPFNYQHLLSGVVNKWIGEQNIEHGRKSLYCFSWVQNTIAVSNGFNLQKEAYFFISAFDDDLIKRVTEGILSDPNLFCGIRATEIQIKDVPEFSNEERLLLNSPILIRQREGERVKHVTFKDRNFDELLTENMKGKLNAVNLPTEGFSIEFDKTYIRPQTKLIDYKGIKNRTTIVPVIIKGTPEQIGFAWTVGLGQSTGIGFGALK